MIYYRDYPDKSNKVNNAIKRRIYSIQGNYGNVNSWHGHLTCKLCGEKGQITTNCKDKDPNYYKNKISNGSDNTKFNHTVTNNTIMHDEDNKQI